MKRLARDGRFTRRPFAIGWDFAAGPARAVARGADARRADADPDQQRAASPSPRQDRLGYQCNEALDGLLTMLQSDLSIFPAAPDDDPPLGMPDCLDGARGFVPVSPRGRAKVSSPSSCAVDLAILMSCERCWNTLQTIRHTCLAATSRRCSAGQAATAPDDADAVNAYAPGRGDIPIDAAALRLACTGCDAGRRLEH